MKKLTFLIPLLLLTLLVAPYSASAHTKLVSSSPEKDEQVLQPISQIQLDFHTDIAPLSSFTLTGEHGTIEIRDIQVEGQQMTGQLDEQLENGTYTVDWKIVGEDGHPMEGNYSFVMNLPEQEEDAAQAEESQAPLDSADNSSNMDTEGNENNVTADTDIGSTNSVPAEEPDGNQTPVIVAGVVIVAAVLAALVILLRRRRS